MVCVLLLSWSVVSVLEDDATIGSLLRFVLNDAKLRSNSSIHSSVIMSVGMVMLVTCRQYGTDDPVREGLKSIRGRWGLLC